MEFIAGNYYLKEVARDIIDDKEICTDFIGFDMSLDFKSRKPIVFETMIFDKKGDHIYCDRYFT